MNADLQLLYLEDQEDLTADRPGREDRARARRERVRAIVAAGGATEGIDYANAAAVLLQGDDPADWAEAHRLAARAAALGFRPARWLAATALDRWLVAQGQPARFGTAWVAFAGAYRRPPCDPATTDADRAAWDVPPLADLVAASPAVPGLPGRRVGGALAVAGLEVQVVHLSRPVPAIALDRPGHAPPPLAGRPVKAVGAPPGAPGHGSVGGAAGAPLGGAAAAAGRPVLANALGWHWVPDGEGVALAWLPLPPAPVVGHVVAGDGLPLLEATAVAGRPAIGVQMAGWYTLYLWVGDRLWAVAGRDRSGVAEQAAQLAAGAPGARGLARL